GSYAGLTTVSTGTLANGIANALPITGALVVSPGASFDLAGFNQTVASITGLGTVTDSAAAAATFTINNAAADTFAGTLTDGSASTTTGKLALTKTGGGTLTLSAASTYAGPTVISTGAVADGTTNALPTGTALSVAGVATFDLAGFSQAVGLLTGTGL